jgi:DNA repair photolyase
MKSKYKSRGAQVNPHNRFFKQEYSREHEEGIDLPPDEEAGQMSFLEVFPKTIVNPVKSPDVGMDYSVNPYQGCEHGCVYCYARNSHEYWGYSAGVDFERKILVKRNAAELLRKKLDSPGWKPLPISLSGNTDCYQPIERKLKITRSLLEVFAEYRHPVGIITKNALVSRDIDILEDLAKDGLARVYLSITTLNEDLRRSLEPRTATIKQRLKTLEQLSEAGIPTGVMMAPIIPGLNSHEILPLVKAVAERGALKVGYTMVRLNGQIGEIFENWLRETFPDRADKVMRQIAHAHGGKVRDSRFGTRMKGEGDYAEMVRNTMAIARERYLLNRVIPEFDTSLFRRPDKGQLSLWK